MSSWKFSVHASNDQMHHLDATPQNINTFISNLKNTKSSFRVGMRVYNGNSNLFATQLLKCVFKFHREFSDRREDEEEKKEAEAQYKEFLEEDFRKITIAELCAKYSYFSEWCTKIVSLQENLQNANTNNGFVIFCGFDVYILCLDSPQMFVNPQNKISRQH